MLLDQYCFIKQIICNNLAIYITRECGTKVSWPEQLCRSGRRSGSFVYSVTNNETAGRENTNWTERTMPRGQCQRWIPQCIGEMITSCETLPALARLHSVPITYVGLPSYPAMTIHPSGVVVRSTDAYKKLSDHPARPVLGWVARVECPVLSHYYCQADHSGYRESVSWLSTVLRKKRKIEVPPTWCSMLGGVKDTTQGVKV